MTAWNWIELTCDHDGCGENFKEHMPTGNIEAARREAKNLGWSAKRGMDYCPDHKAQG